jgi:hypothetical protein
VTVPVAVEGETVAVRITLEPTVGVLVEGESAVVVAVVPVPVPPEPGAFQKFPQPVRRLAAASASTIPAEERRFLIGPFAASITYFRC